LETKEDETTDGASESLITVPLSNTVVVCIKKL
jgi:hypothetical protein